MSPVLCHLEKEPFMFAMSGDVFYHAAEESIFWLDTGNGVVE